ncbi:MAG: serine hydrolase domain-containing protein [Microbacterium sp.]
MVVSLTACTGDTTAELALPDQVDAALADDVQAQMQAAVEQAIAATGSTGAVVGVWVPWAGTWQAGLGTTAIDGAEVTADTTFKAGAVTRSMTCDAMYALAEQERLSPSDPVGDYVSGIPGYEEITLSQLCDSTSGLQSYTGPLAERLRANPSRTWPPRELLAYGMSRGTKNDPGVAFLDADTGYVLLGLALEKASGMTAAELYQEYVFEPMGLTETSLPVDAEVQLNGFRSGDDEDGDVACTEPIDLTALSPSAGYTAFGVETDLTDLGRYIQAVAVQGRSYDTDDRWESPLTISDDGPSWFTAKGGLYQAGTLVGQYGSMPGYLTAAFADSNTGMTVVVVLNNSRASGTIARNLAWELAAIASKAPAADGQTAPEAGLPWTADEMADDIVDAAVCPLPDAE